MLSQAASCAAKPLTGGVLLESGSHGVSGVGATGVVTASQIQGIKAAQGGACNLPGRSPDWLDEALANPNLPPWKRKQLEGQKFNYENQHRYPMNEIVLGNGKRLDSLIPGKEIVSRKNTQFGLGGVQVKTGLGYLKEFQKKYSPGQTIKKTGEVIDGAMILEIPVQNSAIRKEILDYANNAIPKIFLKDNKGNWYN